MFWFSCSRLQLLGHQTLQQWILLFGKDNNHILTITHPEWPKPFWLPKTKNLLEISRSLWRSQPQKMKIYIDSFLLFRKVIWGHFGRWFHTEIRIFQFMYLDMKWQTTFSKDHHVFGKVWNSWLVYPLVNFYTIFKLSFRVLCTFNRFREVTKSRKWLNFSEFRSLKYRRITFTRQ